MTNHTASAVMTSHAAKAVAKTPLCRLMSSDELLREARVLRAGGEAALIRLDVRAERGDVW